MFQGHFTKLYYKTVSLPEQRWQTVLSSVSGGTQAVTEFPWSKLEENSRHATQQMETHDHQWWLDVSVVRRVSTSKQTGGDDVLVHQPSTGVSRKGLRRKESIYRVTKNSKQLTNYQKIILNRIKACLIRLAFFVNWTCQTSTITLYTTWPNSGVDYFREPCLCDIGLDQ